MENSNAQWHIVNQKQTSKIKAFIMEYRVLEFSISLALIVIAAVIAKAPIYQRTIPDIEVPINTTFTVHARDPSIDYKKLSETITNEELIITSLGVISIVNLSINYILPKFIKIQVISHDTRDFALGLIQAIGIAKLFTEFLKVMVGRLRPSFYDMCKWNYDVMWDGVSNLCTDAVWEREGRKSFPSGHASFSASTMFFLTLYLLGRARLTSKRNKSAGASVWKNLQLFISFLPAGFACWVAATRTQNNWHHYSDVFAGSVLGAMGAVFGYGFNYGSIFSTRYSGIPLVTVNAELEKELPTHNSPNCVTIGNHPNDIRQRTSAETTHSLPS